MIVRRKKGERKADAQGIWYAAISEDDPPSIWMVGPWPDCEHFQKGLRVIPVRVTDARLPPNRKTKR